jgi:transposase
MIGPTGAVRVMVATRPVDFRKGAEGLAALVRDLMQADPFDGAIYVFRAKRADRVKMVFWDGTGVEFRWPKIEDGVSRALACADDLECSGIAVRAVERRQVSARLYPDGIGLRRRPLARIRSHFISGEPSVALCDLFSGWAGHGRHWRAAHPGCTGGRLYSWVVSGAMGMVFGASGRLEKLRA